MKNPKYKPLNPKKEPLTVEKLQSFPGLDKLSHDEAWEMVFSIQALCAIIIDYQAQIDRDKNDDKGRKRDKEGLTCSS